MASINRNEVGVRVSGTKVSFGLYLPGIKQVDGYDVRVRIIFADDQFDPDIPAVEQSLVFDPTHALGLWSLTLDVAALPAPPGNFGNNGRYLYRFKLLRNGQVVTTVFLDPFATSNGPGLLSAFTVNVPSTFAWTDQNHVTPPLDDLIVYELDVAEFNVTFQGVIDRLDYLEGLGINCLELMPITPVKREFDWGYGPIGYFAPEDSLGSNDDLKRLIDACHARGMAVILDVVYGHADGAAFPYARVYDDTHLPNPVMQDPNHDNFGRGFEHTRAFTQEYCLAANQYWLDEYHVDGFRYDNVPGFYDGDSTKKYGTLAFNTYVYSRAIARFKDAGGFSRIIQCAEDLNDPKGILSQTLSNSTWQDGLLNKVRDMAKWNYVDEAFAHLLDPSFGNDHYPETKDAAPAGDKPFPVAPFQYLNSHDHSWLITEFGLEPPMASGDVIRFGDRDRFYKLQPYAIALLASKGVPMLWQGEEFGENYQVADGGALRVSILRGMHWEYFYDESGFPLVRVYRRMGKLRRALPALRSRDFFYFNVQSRPGDGVIAFRRKAAGTGGQPDQIALVVLNFSDVSRTVVLPAPATGTYREMLDRPNRPAGQELELVAANAGDGLTITVSPNYGCVFVMPPPTV